MPASESPTTSHVPRDYGATRPYSRGSTAATPLGARLRCMYNATCCQSHLMLGVAPPREKEWKLTPELQVTDEPGHTQSLQD